MAPNPENDQWLVELVQVTEPGFEQDIVKNLITAPATTKPGELGETTTLTLDELLRQQIALYEIEKYLTDSNDYFRDGFPQFKKLPIEIRLAIWKMSLPGSRMIEMKFKRNIARRPMDFRLLDSEFPTLLHVNQEARAEALKFYQPVFGDITVDSEHQRKVYFDPSKDTLYVRQGISTRRHYQRDALLNLANKDIVKHLAIEPLGITSELGVDILPVPLHFPNLSDLTILSPLDYRDHEFWHPGLCRESEEELSGKLQGRHCIVTIEETSKCIEIQNEENDDGSNPGRQDPFYVERFADHFQSAMNAGASFLTDARADNFGVTDWNEPKFLYKNACGFLVGSQVVRDKDSNYYYDPPVRAARVQSAQELAEIAALPADLTPEERHREVYRIKHNYCSANSVQKRQNGETPLGKVEFRKRERARRELELVVARIAEEAEEAKKAEEAQKAKEAQEAEEPGDTTNDGGETIMKPRKRSTFADMDSEIAAIPSDLTGEQRDNEERRIRNNWSSKKSYQKQREQLRQEAEEQERAEENGDDTAMNGSSEDVAPTFGDMTLG